MLLFEHEKGLQSKVTPKRVTLHQCALFLNYGTPPN